MATLFVAHALAHKTRLGLTGRHRRELQREAAGAAGALQLVGTGSGTYSIESRARLADGREAALRTVVRAGASPVPGSAYTLLRWEEGASPQ